MQMAIGCELAVRSQKLDHWMIMTLLYKIEAVRIGSRGSGHNELSLFLMSMLRGPVLAWSSSLATAAAAAAAAAAAVVTHPQKREALTRAMDTGTGQRGGEQSMHRGALTSCGRPEVPCLCCVLEPCHDFSSFVFQGGSPSARRACCAGLGATR